MKLTKLAITAVFLILFLYSGTVSIFAAEKDSTFKVIGYYSGDLFNEPIENLQLDKLTHIMYAFLIPREDGSLIPLEKPEQLEAIVKKSKETGTKVYISLGGWSYQGNPLAPTFEKLASTEKGRKTLIDNVVNFAKEHGLAGVEIDWEYPNADTIHDYETFVTELSSRLEAEGMHLSAAVNGAWSTTGSPEASSLLTDRCLNSFSFINVMAYDMNNEEHSPLWFADTSIDYWLNRGVPREKIVLGMPLYARPTWLQYRQLVALDPENAYRDKAETKEGTSYYNGLNTLREKTMIALRKAGGVMLFDVNEDAPGDASVVSMIHDVLDQYGSMSSAELANVPSVILDHKPLVFNGTDNMGIPFINADGRVEIPFRKPLEAIGAKVSYDAEKNTAKASWNGTTVWVAVGDKNVYVRKDEKGTVERVPIDTQAVIIEGRTYLPMRAVFEAFGYDVTWSAASKTAYASRQK